MNLLNRRAAAAGAALADTLGTDEELRRLPRLSRDEIDALPFSAIKVDDDGVITLYSRQESELVNIPVEEAEGRNFFTELAPCTNNALVLGRFRDGIAANELDYQSNYALTYKIRPILVKLRLWRDPETRTNWVLIRRLGASK